MKLTKKQLYIGLAVGAAALIAITRRATTAMPIAGGTGSLNPYNSSVTQITGTLTPLGAPSLNDYFTQNSFDAIDQAFSGGPPPYFTQGATHSGDAFASTFSGQRAYAA